MIPLHDDQPHYGRPLGTRSLIVLNLLVFLFTWTLDKDRLSSLLFTFGLVPVELLGRGGDSFELLTPLTSQFLHGGWIHLIGNLWFLHLFGDNVEDRLGHLHFLLFYLCAGIAGAALTLALDPQSPVPMIGASGAISGVLGAYLLWYPRAGILTLFTLGFIFRRIRVPAWIFIGLWFLGQLVGFAIGGGGIAWGAHLGGFLFGLLWALVMGRFRATP